MQIGDHVRSKDRVEVVYVDGGHGNRVIHRAEVIDQLPLRTLVFTERQRPFYFFVRHDDLEVID